jgi:hypothetical protein
MEEYITLCLKCKKKGIVQDAEIVTMKTGMKAAKGKCSFCGGKLYKILPKNKKDEKNK